MVNRSALILLLFNNLAQILNRSALIILLFNDFNDFPALLLAPIIAAFYLAFSIYGASKSLQTPLELALSSRRCRRLKRSSVVKIKQLKNKLKRILQRFRRPIFKESKVKSGNYKSKKKRQSLPAQLPLAFPGLACCLSFSLFTCKESFTVEPHTALEADRTFLEGLGIRPTLKKRCVNIIFFKNIMNCTIRNTTKLNTIGKSTSKKALGLLGSDVRPIKPTRHDLCSATRSITGGGPRLFD
jgi:hypothetical protein